MSDPFIGEIRLLPFQFAPQGWLVCDGSLRTIQTYQALFSILWNRYGGDGKSTFGLPDLRNQAVVGMYVSGSGNGLTPYSVNQKLGVGSVSLTNLNTPPHNHNLKGAIAAPASITGLSANAWLSHPVKPGTPNELANVYVDTIPAGTQVTLNNNSLSDFPGQSGAHDNHQPYLTLQYCIAWDGVYPVQS